MKWDYNIEGYAGHKHPAVRAGDMRAHDLILITTHAGEASRDIEIAAYRSRMERGEVSRIEVIDLNNHTRQTITA